MKGASPSGAKIFCRCYGTFLAAVLACVGAETWAVAGVMVAFGAVFDLCRSFIAPDLTMGEMALAESVVRAANDPTIALPYKAAVRRWAWIIYGLWFGYTILFTFVQPMLSAHASRAYLTFFEPLYRLCSLVFALARNHEHELLQHGYAARVPVIAHIYTFNWIMFTISLGSNLLVRAYERVHSVKLKADTIALLQTARWQYLVVRIGGGVAIASCCYVVVSHMIPIDWTHRWRQSWDVQDSNVPFHMMTWCLIPAELMFSWAYSYAIWYRAWVTLQRTGQSPRLTAAPV